MTSGFRIARRLSGVCVVLVVVTAVVLRPAPPAARADTAHDASVSLASVLGDTSAWDVARYGTAPGDWEVKQVDGHTVLLPGAHGTIISTHQPISGDAVVDAVFRLASTAPDYPAVSADFEPGLKTLDDAGKGIGLSLGVRAGAANADFIYWGMYGDAQHADRYCLWWLPESRQNWPRDVRLHAEQDIAGQPHLAQRWVSVRWVLHKNAFEVYLDGRLLEERRGPGVNVDGMFEFRAFPGVQVASMKVTKTGPDDPIFVPVSIDADLNTSRFAAQGIAAGSLPSGQTKAIAGVPFAFPVVDDRGNNHITLAPSWVTGACTPGATGYGENARWMGALQRNPGRIQFRIRNARYARLHLIAASDGAPDTVPIVTAQFFRTADGHPLNFETHVPLFTAHSSAKDALPIRLADGRTGNLFQVTIELEPDSLSAFSDTDVVELELTKQVQLYRGSPDPMYFSVHAAGLPSSVHVFAVTLERPAVDFDFEPDRFAHIFTAPLQPSYTLTLRNLTGQDQKVHAVVTTTSHDGQERTPIKQSTTVPPHGQAALHFAMDLKKYGYHDVKLSLKDEQGERTRNISLAYLHADTREHGDWEEGKGVIYGMWDWNGTDKTPKGVPRLQFAYDVGIESSMGSFNALTAPEKEFVLKHKMVTRFRTNVLKPNKDSLGVEWDPTKPEAMAKAVVDSISKDPDMQDTPYNHPSIASFLGEPMLGTHMGICVMSLPEYYNDPPYQMSADEVASVQQYMPFLLIAGHAIKKQWPNTRIGWPYGISNYPIAFMRASKDAAELMDGPAVDMALFEREPELQVGQVTLQNELWQLKQEWAKHAATKPWPKMVTLEGPGVSPAMPGSLTQDEEAQNTTRVMLALMAYNVDQILGWPVLFQCANFWGENHYGSGLSAPMPLLNPHVDCAAFATLTRQINRVNYTKYIPTGSLSAYCMQFKHYKTPPAPEGELLHVMWTLRGKRPVTLDVPAGTSLEVYDSMDNLQTLKTHGGKATFTITAAPCFIHGLTTDANVTLGEPDHSDAQPAAESLKLANLGDGSWKVTNDRDDYYETAHFEFSRQFPGPMTGKQVDAPHHQGGKALAIHVEKQDKDRLTMPHYAMLVPAKPITIPGKASHLGLWVQGHSDWGRVVYFVRDANGREWVSVGTQDQWNNDDTHAWSQFCFDGWRYLDFELPSTAPWDGYMEAGRVWWGGPEVDGDTPVALPLTLERIAIERRDHVVYVTDLLPADTTDVQLGDLYAEYASASDRTPEAVRISKVRVPLPAATARDNPITKLEADGVGAPTSIQRVEPPAQEYDGRRCLVYFAPVSGAASYDVWVSRHADGSDALNIGAGMTAPGELLQGLYSNTDLYLFLTWTGKDGKVSKPSKAFKINLKDMFPMK